MYFGLLGLLVGSAINAMVWRLHVGKSWVKGRSMCPDCGHELAAKDLVPVVSWLWLRGKCRYCKAGIHWQYPAVEALTAGLFALSFYVMQPQTLPEWGMLVWWLVLLVLLIVLAVYDARWMLLPDTVMLPAIGWAMIPLVAHLVLGEWRSVLGPLLAALAVGGLFYAVVAVSRGRAMGGGDIKLVFLMGLVLGVQAMGLALLLAFNVAAVVGLILIGLKLKKRRDHIPFGPFLAGAAIIAFLYGREIVAWYINITYV